MTVARMTRTVGKYNKDEVYDLEHDKFVYFLSEGWASKVQPVEKVAATTGPEVESVAPKEKKGRFNRAVKRAVLKD